MSSSSYSRYRLSGQVSLEAIQYGQRGREREIDETGIKNAVNNGCQCEY
jgi:hypothetical protein